MRTDVVLFVVAVGSLVVWNCMSSHVTIDQREAKQVARSEELNDAREQYEWLRDKEWAH